MLDVRFGRCSYFMSTTQKVMVKVIRKQRAVSSGGAGTAAAQLILDEDEAEYW